MRLLYYNETFAIIIVFVINSDRDGAQYNVVSLALCLGLWKLRCAQGHVKVRRSNLFLGHEYCQLRGTEGASTLGHFHLEKVLLSFIMLQYHVSKNHALVF